MPELPDVQVFKQYVDVTALHQRIRDVTVAADGMLEGVSSRTLKSRLIGHELASTRRHGKHLFVRVTGEGWLRLHFGMTGEVRYFKDDGESPEHCRLRLDLSNGYHLAYVNVHKFGAIGMVDDVDAFVEDEGLGPDALELDLHGFRAALEGRRGAIKSTLMNQNVMAGIGNVYADELLLAAGVDPRARTDRLEADTIRDLHRAMRTVLAQAIEARVEVDRLPRSFLLPHRDDEGKCPRCGAALKRAKVGGAPLATARAISSGRADGGVGARGSLPPRLSAPGAQGTRRCLARPICILPVRRAAWERPAPDRLPRGHGSLGNGGGLVDAPGRGVVGAKGRYSHCPSIVRPICSLGTLSAQKPS
jgi:formamidopyrimidine-DNA glycosylase